MNRVNKRILNKYLKYPYNLIYRLFESTMTIAQFEDKKESLLNCAELEESLEYVLQSLLPNDKRVVEGIYKENRSLKELAEELYVTRERIRQRELKAIRKLRHQVRLEILRLGISEYQSLKELKKSGLAPLDLTEMNLSIRPYNILRRAGLNTSEDVYQNSDRIYKLRNCGEISYREIVNAMKELGYDTTTMEQNKLDSWRL